MNCHFGERQIQRVYKVTSSHLEVIVLCKKKLVAVSRHAFPRRPLPQWGYHIVTAQLNDWEGAFEMKARNVV